MPRRKKNQLRCRATVHMSGDRPVGPGDEVVIDPTDPWMLGKIARGYLVPLEEWEPPAALESSPEPPVLSASALDSQDEAPSAAALELPGDDADAPVDEATPEGA